MSKISKLAAILPKSGLWRVPILLLAMLVGAALEVLGIGLIIPFLDAVSGSGDNELLAFMRAELPGHSEQDLILLSVGAFAAVYLFKGLYLAFLAWVLARFFYSVQVKISNRLIKSYTEAPYEFHLENNSSQLIRNLTTELTLLLSNVLAPIMLIATEGLVIIAIGLFLLALEPVGTLIVMAMFAFLSFEFQFFLGRYSFRLGAERQIADGLIVQKAQEALGGIKEVKVLGKERYFAEMFNQQKFKSAMVSAKQHALNQFPRMYLETIGVLVFSLLVIFLTLRDGAFVQSLSTLGVFALAAFKLLPSANRLLSAVNKLSFAEPIINALHRQLDKSSKMAPDMATGPRRQPSFVFGRDIELDQLSYKYPSAADQALSDVTLTIRKGDSVGIIGKSGAGKSTVLDVFLGLLRPSAGSLRVDGVSVYDNIQAWRELVSYVQQDVFLLDDSITRNVAFGLHNDDIDRQKVERAIAEAQLDGFVSSLPDGLDTALGERGVRLSGGQKQRIGIARALYRDTPIIVLDEATSALDNETERDIVSAIKRLKGIKTVIVIAHRLSTIEHCDRVVELKDGKILRISDKNE